MNTKQNLLSELAETYVMLRTSNVHGVGVFAIRDIPKGCTNIFSQEIGEWVHLSFEETANLDLHIQSLIENYCLYDESGYFIPAQGFKCIDISLCINHSDTPNIHSKQDGAYFETLRDIACGEELLIDYGSIVEYH